MKRIPNFTSINTTNSGLDRMQILSEERTGWRDPQQLYSDKFYKTLLIQRMKDWDKLSFECNAIQGTEAMTFPEAKIRVLRAVKRFQEDIYLNESRHFTTPPIKSNDVEPNITMDSVALNFQGSAVQQSMMPRLQYNTIKCFNCGVIGHGQNRCIQPWCSNCNQQWQTTNDTNYHQMNRCLLRPPDNRPNTSNLPHRMAEPRPRYTQRIEEPRAQPQPMKRPFVEQQQQVPTPQKQPYQPRPMRPPFPQKGTAPRPMRTNAVVSYDILTGD